MAIGDNNLSWSTLDVSGLASGNPRWFDVRTLDQMLPGFYSESMTIIQDANASLAPVLNTIYQFVNIVQQLIPSDSYSTLSTFVVSNLLIQIRRLIADLENSGVYGLFMGPKYGGSIMLGRRFDSSLLNADDKYRPIVSPSGTVGSISFVWGSPSSDVAAALFTALGTFISAASAATTQQALDAKAESKVVAPADRAPYTTLFNSTLPHKGIPHVAWYGYALKDLMQGSVSADAAKALDQVLNYLNRLTTPNAFTSFSAILLRQIAMLTQQLQILQQFLDDLAGVLSQGPLTAFLVPPAAGGSAAWRTSMLKGLQGGYGGPVYGTSTYVGMLTVAVAGTDTVKVNAAWEALTRFYYGALQSAAAATKPGG
jgi:hypothetical protein